MRIPTVKRWLVKTTLTDGTVRRRFVLAPTQYLARLNDRHRNTTALYLEQRLGFKSRTYTSSRAAS